MRKMLVVAIVFLVFWIPSEAVIIQLGRYFFRVVAKDLVSTSGELIAKDFLDAQVLVFSKSGRAIVYPLLNDVRINIMTQVINKDFFIGCRLPEAPKELANILKFDYKPIEWTGKFKVEGRSFFKFKCPDMERMPAESLHPAPNQITFLEDYKAKFCNKINDVHADAFLKLSSKVPSSTKELLKSPKKIHAEILKIRDDALLSSKEVCNPNQCFSDFFSRMNNYRNTLAKRRGQCCNVCKNELCNARSKMSKLEQEINESKIKIERLNNELPTANKKKTKIYNKLVKSKNGEDKLLNTINSSDKNSKEYIEANNAIEKTAKLSREHNYACMKVEELEKDINNMTSSINELIEEHSKSINAFNKANAAHNKAFAEFDELEKINDQLQRISKQVQNEEVLKKINTAKDAFDGKVSKASKDAIDAFNRKVEASAESPDAFSVVDAGKEAKSLLTEKIEQAERKLMETLREETSSISTKAWKITSEEFSKTEETIKQIMSVTLDNTAEFFGKKISINKIKATKFFDKKASGMLKEATEKLQEQVKEFSEGGTIGDLASRVSENMLRDLEIKVASMRNEAETALNTKIEQASTDVLRNLETALEIARYKDDLEGAFLKAKNEAESDFEIKLQQAYVETETTFKEKFSEAYNEKANWIKEQLVKAICQSREIELEKTNNQTNGSIAILLEKINNDKLNLGKQIEDEVNQAIDSKIAETVGVSEEVISNAKDKASEALMNVVREGNDEVNNAVDRIFNTAKSEINDILSQVRLSIDKPVKVFNQVIPHAKNKVLEIVRQAEIDVDIKVSNIFKQAETKAHTEALKAFDEAIPKVNVEPQSEILLPAAPEKIHAGWIVTGIVGGSTIVLGGIASVICWAMGIR